jgi:hypothetical protein
MKIGITLFVRPTKPLKPWQFPPTEVVTVRAVKAFHGLAVHRGLGIEHKRWVVTHIRSGGVLARGKTRLVFRRQAQRNSTPMAFRSQAQAIACLNVAARLGDWSDWSCKEVIPKRVRRRAKQNLMRFKVDQ